MAKEDWCIGTVQELLGLSDREVYEIERKIKLGKAGWKEAYKNEFYDKTDEEIINVINIKWLQQNKFKDNCCPQEPKYEDGKWITEVLLNMSGNVKCSIGYILIDNDYNISYKNTIDIIREAIS